MDKLSRLPGFIPYVLIVFINAFVDLGHKILIQNTVFKVYDGQTQVILTAIVNGLILLPFVLLFTPAGFLSDKYAKPRVIKIAAAVAIGLTLLITLSYYQGWFEFAFGLTFLLAVQSAFYSPAKYGYIKELAGKERLTTANAVVQAVTIVAILSGIFVFSMLFEHRLAGVEYSTEPEILQHIAPVGWMLVAFAALEFMFALRLQPVEAESPNRRFQRSSDRGYPRLDRFRHLHHTDATSSVAQWFRYRRCRSPGRRRRRSPSSCRQRTPRRS